MQKQTDGRFHPVAYYSKTASPAESKYHSFELETLAIFYALERFRIYLKGIVFTIVTDCNSLAQTLEKKNMNTRIARRALEFSRYTFVPKHRPGLSMTHVDALSRCHAPEEIENIVALLLSDPGAPKTTRKQHIQRSTAARLPRSITLTSRASCK